MVVEEIPPFYVKRFENTEKHYINVTNYYYYYYYYRKFKRTAFYFKYKNLVTLSKSLLSLLIKFAE